MKQYLGSLVLIPLLLILINISAAQKNISGIRLVPILRDSICPGDDIEVDVYRVTDKGKLKYLSRKQSEHFNFRVQGGTFERGTLHLSPDCRDFSDHRVLFEVSMKDRQDIRACCSIPLNYKYRTIFNISGAHGEDGRKGESRSGAFLIGRDGNDGESGSSGFPGSNGTDVNVYIELRYLESISSDVLSVVCVTADTEVRFLLNPEKGGLFVVSDGGHGGNGGKGGHASSGKSACTDCGLLKVSQEAGHGGNGGNGGDGGPGGRGGHITFFADSTVNRYMPMITYSNVGGAGGTAAPGGSAGSGGAGIQKAGDGSGNGGIQWEMQPGEDGIPGKDGENGTAGSDGQVLYMEWPSKQHYRPPVR